jgi:hypothetical protein
MKIYNFLILIGAIVGLIASETAVSSSTISHSASYDFTRKVTVVGSFTYSQLMPTVQVEYGSVNSSGVFTRYLMVGPINARITGVINGVGSFDTANAPYTASVGTLGFKSSLSEVDAMTQKKSVTASSIGTLEVK